MNHKTYDFDFDNDDEHEIIITEKDFDLDEDEIAARDARIKADTGKYREDDDLIKNATDFDKQDQYARTREVRRDEEGYLHDDKYYPAIEGKHNEYHYKHGYLHKDDGPAAICAISTYSPSYYYAYEGKFLGGGESDNGWIALFRLVSEEKREKLVQYLEHKDPWDNRVHNLKAIWQQLTDDEKCHRLLLDLFTSNLSELG